jgi:hypothetical protein
MKIYVASSWRNPWQPGVVTLLRDLGHEVYDFRNPKPGNDGFRWSEIDGGWRSWTPAQYREELDSQIAKDGFKLDFDAMKWADACVLVQPCGTSAHLELGWACGAGKRTAVLFPFGMPLPTDAKTRKAFGHSLDKNAPCGGCGDLDGCHVPGKLNRIEPELMVKCADALLLSADELRAWVGG